MLKSINGYLSVLYTKPYSIFVKRRATEKSDERVEIEGRILDGGSGDAPTLGRAQPTHGQSRLRARIPDLMSLIQNDAFPSDRQQLHLCSCKEGDDRFKNTFNFKIELLYPPFSSSKSTAFSSSSLLELSLFITVLISERAVPYVVMTISYLDKL